MRSDKKQAILLERSKYKARPAESFFWEEHVFKKTNIFNLGFTGTSHNTNVCHSQPGFKGE